MMQHGQSDLPFGLVPLSIAIRNFDENLNQKPAVQGEHELGEPSRVGANYLRTASGTKYCSGAIKAFALLQFFPKGEKQLWVDGNRDGFVGHWME
jgi:hypothetical protein